MKLMKIEFTEWRDPPAPRGREIVSEVEVATRRFAECSQREISMRGELLQLQKGLIFGPTQQLKDREVVLLAELDVTLTSKQSARAVEVATAELAMQSIKSHTRVGSVGYQILNDEATKVERVVDLDGNDPPAGAVYGYRITDQAPPLPAWAA